MLLFLFFLFWIHDAAVALILVKSLPRTSIWQGTLSACWFLGWFTLGFCDCILHFAHFPFPPPFLPCTLTPGLSRCCSQQQRGCPEASFALPLCLRLLMFSIRRHVAG